MSGGRNGVRDGAGFPSTARLVSAQIRYQVLLFWRVPIALFFTLLFPLMVLVLFNALFGDTSVPTEGGEWPIRQFYTGGLAVFTAVSATYTNLANMVPIRRDEGVLKRWRGTPLPTWVYVAGAIGSSVAIALLGVVIMLGLGVVAYGLEIDAAKLPAAAITFVVGVGAFAALGMAVAALVPTASAASAVANATILPLAFVSNVFIVIQDPPRWLALVGDAFPLKPFVSSFQDAFNPFVDAPAFNWPELGFIALWGVFGLVVAVARFRWEPSSGGTTRRRRSGREPEPVVET
ncbi:MAG: ABC transporter permease [Ilumatobacteraceae bacterium]